MEGTLEELRRISNCPEGATFSQLGLRKSVGDSPKLVAVLDGGRHGTKPITADNRKEEMEAYRIDRFGSVDGIVLRSRARTLGQARRRGRRSRSAKPIVHISTGILLHRSAAGCGSQGSGAAAPRCKSGTSSRSRRWLRQRSHRRVGTPPHT